MNLVTAKNVAMSFGNTGVFKGLNLTLSQDDRLAILGASGTGKSTLLRLLAGLAGPTAGVIERAPDLRVGMVFQDLALWPNLSALENVAIALPRLAKPQRMELARNALTKCRVQELASRKPCTLSIGQQQRVALARAIGSNPQLLLLDEPFSSLDPLLREELMEEVQRLVDEIKSALVLVTHDVFEALTLTSRAIVLEDKSVAESGDLASLVADPKSRLLRQFVAQAERLKRLLKTV